MAKKNKSKKKAAAPAAPQAAASVVETNTNTDGRYPGMPCWLGPGKFGQLVKRLDNNQWRILEDDSQDMHDVDGRRVVTDTVSSPLLGTVFCLPGCVHTVAQNMFLIDMEQDIMITQGGTCEPYRHPDLSWTNVFIKSMLPPRCTRNDVHKALCVVYGAEHVHIVTSTPAADPMALIQKVVQTQQITDRSEVLLIWRDDCDASQFAMLQGIFEREEAMLQPGAVQAMHMHSWLMFECGGDGNFVSGRPVHGKAQVPLLVDILKDGDDMECPICLEGIHSSPAHVLACGHACHISCLEEMYKTRRMCALCEYPIHFEFIRRDDNLVCFRDITEDQMGTANFRDTMKPMTLPGSGQHA